MFYVALSILLFIASMAVHMLFCRTTARPGLHAKAFVIVAAIFFCVYAASASAAAQAGLLDPRSLWGMPFRITSSVIFIALVPVYLCFYVLTQLVSPSQKILLTVLRRGKLSYADIVACVQEEDFIMTRLNELCASGCVVQAQGRYVLSPHGRKIALVLKIMQSVLGRQAGG